METAVAEAYERGKSKSQAKVAARQAIADYYAVKQVNMLESHNVTVSSWQSLRDQAYVFVAYGRSGAEFAARNGDGPGASLRLRFYGARSH
ncbi:hypothetical protein [Halobaculum rarum]|uniref:hypothetical protein n=1 Tax=Halobaculum rarum TaxID=3075122 RepID=UPI0032AF9E00